jgi:Arylsulfotransferase (ASST)
MILLLLPSLSGLYGQATPPDIPSLRITWYQDTALCNYMFLSTERFVLPTNEASTAMILDRRGYVAWYAKSEDNLFSFGPQPNGKLAFNVNEEWYELDSTMNATLFPTCSVGSGGDFHDFMHLANGNSLELCNDDTILDLSHLHTYNGQQGASVATVRYNVVEERSANGFLLKRWRGIDHFSPDDVDSLYFDYPWFLELTHTNSIDYKAGKVLLSHRNLHAVTLIDWPTGNVVWQLGGVQSDFYFLNDGGFNAQHDARFVGTDRISIFDNRSKSAVRTPRGVVYSLDTALGLATKVYDRTAPTAESSSMGSFRVLPNGDGLVSWGTKAPPERASLSYYHPNGQKVCDMQLQLNHHSYRAVCENLPFTLTRPQITCNRQNNTLLLEAAGTYTNYLWSTGSTAQILVVPDTGYYQLYLPLGMGYVGSNVFHVTNLAGNCPSTDAADGVEATRPRQLQATYDLLGRPVEAPTPGHIYIERYRDGRSRKVVAF